MLLEPIPVTESGALTMNKHLNGLLYASYAITIGVQLTRYKDDLKSYNSLLHNNRESKTEQAQFDRRNGRVEVSSRKGDEAQVAGCRLKHTITKAPLKHSHWKGTSCSKILNVRQSTKSHIITPSSRAILT